MKRFRGLGSFFIFLASILAIVIIFSYFTPEEIIGELGIRNSYLVIFFVSFFAGFSAGTSFSMIAILVAFVFGGMNPIWLALVSGLGLMAGDLLMFYFGLRARAYVSRDWDRRLKEVEKLFGDKLHFFVPTIIYFYLGFIPLPNDFLIIFLAAINYPIKKASLPIVLGDLTYPLIICILAARGIVLFA